MAINVYFIYFLILSSMLFLMQAGSAHKPNYADCMKNPFAIGCRGISAKRSELPATLNSDLVLNGARMESMNSNLQQLAENNFELRKQNALLNELMLTRSFLTRPAIVQSGEYYDSYAAKQDKARVE